MAYKITDQVGSGQSTKGNRQTTAYNFRSTTTNEKVANWGQQASRSLYSVFANQQDNRMGSRDLLNSRLWHGVPQLTTEQMNMFEAAYTGHTFIFITEMPKFMYTGMYYGTNLHYQIRNLKSVIERASTGFSGAQNITAEFADQDDGNGRKVSHMVYTHKDQGDVSLTLHEFAGLPVKNALESWLTGVYDYRSEHGNYFGNLGIPGGWCLSNHSMAMLVVQVDPSWQTIQDAAYYYNMMPTEVPFDHFEWTKGEHTIVPDYTITFKANEERSPMIMYAAERFMNNRILSMVATSVYNSRQFVVDNFGSDSVPKDYQGFRQSIGAVNDSRSDAVIIDKQQYNIEITNLNDNGTQITTSGDSAIEEYQKLLNEDNAKRAAIRVNKYTDDVQYANDKAENPEYYNPYNLQDEQLDNAISSATD